VRYFFSKYILVAAVAGSLTLIAACGQSEVTNSSVSVRIASPEQIHAHIDSLRGNVVLVNLWATWCGPCVAEFPHLTKVARDYADRGLRVVAVSVDQPNVVESAVIPFVTRHNAPFDVLVKDWSDPMLLLESFDANLSGAIPTSLLYDRDGKLKSVVERGLNERQLAAMITPNL